MATMDSPSSWKLYDNPHYADRRHDSPSSSSNNHHRHQKQHHPYTCISKSRSSYHTRDLPAFSNPMDNRNVNLSDLDNALAEIKELRAELEFERRMRKKLEEVNRALAKEVAEERRQREAAERRQREAAERTCEGIGEEIAHLRKEAEAMREERVQMKPTDAKILMEEKIKEMMPTESSNCKRMMTTPMGEEKRDHQQPVENPHIKRGIKGLEFPKAVRARGNGMSSSPSSREGRRDGHSGSNLECQRAQLRVLMRAKSSVGSAIVGAGENLVM